MSSLTFGTAGIRAQMGPRDDQINARTVRAVAEALVSYLLEQLPDARERGLCVGYDGRAQSDEFAREVCGVALAQGMVVRRFAEPVTTPLIAFCTRRFAAAAGVMITASHNPPADNGIKVYWQGGAQILAPHDAAIAQRIPERIAAGSAEVAVNLDAAVLLGEVEIDAYVAALAQLIAEPRQGELPRIAYTALCGTGTNVTRRLFVALAVKDVVEVTEQAEPRPDFGGLTSPNPEQMSALQAVLALAEQAQAGLVFAHDPDADRLAVAVRTRAGTLRVLNGDEVGALLGDFALSLHAGKRTPLVVSTVVSSGLLAEIARARGARYERTLTGFKWIAARARALEASEQLEFVFGYEEAIGYAFGALGDDKDGVAALRALVDLGRRLHARGLTLADALSELAQRHGLFVTRQITLRADSERMTRLMSHARALDPSLLLGPGATRSDYLAQAERANLLVFSAPDGTRLCVRPSGTEPKVKFYLESRTPIATGESEDDAALRARARLDALAASIDREFA